MNIPTTTFLWRDSASRQAMFGILFMPLLGVLAYLSPTYGDDQGWSPTTRMLIVLLWCLGSGVVTAVRMGRLRRANAGSRADGVIVERQVFRHGVLVTVRFKAGSRTVEAHHKVQGGPPLQVDTPVTVAYAPDAPSGGLVVDAFQ